MKINVSSEDETIFSGEIFEVDRLGTQGGREMSAALTDFVHLYTTGEKTKKRVVRVRFKLTGI